MNSAALLDLLGNENRRRILRLLARKPCYVTEISDYLGVSPKAVIDHLRKLEEAGLVESRVDDQRRKYFHIARNVRLEVNVSPYRFGAKSAYPASVSLDLTRWRHLSIDADCARGETDGTSGEPATDAAPDAGPAEMARQLREYEELEEELSMAQRWVQGRLTETLDRIGDVVDRNADAPPEVDSRLYADILLALEEHPRVLDDLATDLDAAPRMVREALDTLAEAGLVTRHGDRWGLAAE